MGFVFKAGMMEGMRDATKDKQNATQQTINK
jgi:hypothetical protein